MLEVRNIQTYYGNIQALKNVSMTINEGEIVTPSTSSASASARFPKAATSSRR